MLTRKVPAEVVFLKPLIIFMKLLWDLLFQKWESFDQCKLYFCLQAQYCGVSELQAIKLKMILVMIFIDR